MPPSQAEYDRLWQSKFNALKEYLRRHGHCNIPWNDKTHSSLANWVMTQRRNHGSGTLNKDRMKKLNEIGFSWEPDSISQKALLEERWEQRLQQLKEHVKRTGSFRVPRKTNSVLNAWVRWQRRARRMGTLNEDRMKKLIEIGFPWEADSISLKQQALTRERLSATRVTPHQTLGEKRWGQRLHEVQEHAQHTGSFHVRVSENKQLSDWIHTQRHFRRKGTLRGDRIDRLNEIGFPWEADGFWRKRKYSGEGGKVNSHATQTYPVGTRVCKKFGTRFYSGRVTKYNTQYGWYWVRYEDNDNAEYTEEELREILVPEEDLVDDSDMDDSASASSTDPELTSVNAVVDGIEDTRVVADPVTSSDVSWKYPIGTRVRTRFRGYGWFSGEVVARFAPDYYRVLYSDGDVEDTREIDLEAILVPNVSPASNGNTAVKSESNEAVGDDGGLNNVATIFV